LLNWKLTELEIAVKALTSAVPSEPVPPVIRMFSGFEVRFIRELYQISTPVDKRLETLL